MRVVSFSGAQWNCVIAWLNLYRNKLEFAHLFQHDSDCREWLLAMCEVHLLFFRFHACICSAYCGRSLSPRRKPSSAKLAMNIWVFGKVITGEQASRSALNFGHGFGSTILFAAWRTGTEWHSVLEAGIQGFTWPYRTCGSNFTIYGLLNEAK